MEKELSFDEKCEAIETGIDDLLGKLSRGELTHKDVIPARDYDAAALAFDENRKRELEAQCREEYALRGKRERQELRDRFICAALTGLCSIGNTIDTQNDEHRALRAVDIADLTLSARDKGEA